MKRTITTISVAVILGLACPIISSAEEEKETTMKMSDVPQAVQKAAETEAKGGKILRWEKEDENYEVVIDKNGKEWGIKMDANGKVLSKHNERKEKGEKEEHEKH